MQVFSLINFIFFDLLKYLGILNKFFSLEYVPKILYFFFKKLFRHAIIKPEVTPIINRLFFIDIKLLNIIFQKKIFLVQGLIFFYFFLLTHYTLPLKSMYQKKIVVTFFYFFQSSKRHKRP